MKDVKVSLLIVVSCLLLMAAFIVLWTWGYHSYYKERDEKRSAALFTKDSISIANGTRDSIQKLYLATLNKLNTTIDSTQVKTDSITGNLDTRLKEFYRLSDEIATILKNRKADADPGSALRKIADLQKKIDDLRNRNIDVEDENKQLASVLQQISDERKIPVQNIRTVNLESKPPQDPVAEASYGASDLRLAAVTVNNEKEQETTSAERAEKIVGSFSIKNNVNQNTTGEMVIVVLQPDGQVLQKSTWESGSFNTTEGKKVYSVKLRVDSAPKEAKRLNFSLTSDNYQKGNYIFQIYHNGKMIGRAVKTLT
ncbi:MAG TPA: hypothetical protein VK498_15065 [Ferruginibacter sp.]|nr:hypothetical protein [Ferruginibacter sp.]